MGFESRRSGSVHSSGAAQITESVLTSQSARLTRVYISFNVHAVKLWKWLFCPMGQGKKTLISGRESVYMFLR